MAIKKNPTIRDVAAAAGVSIATVSRFVNGQQTFSDAVEARLKHAIETLGYSRNPIARSMVTGRTGAIGLAVMDIGNPHNANVVKGANRVALANGYNLLVVDIEERLEGAKQLLEALARRTDGLIVSERVPDDVVEWLIELPMPVVFIGQTGIANSVCVSMDNVAAAEILGAYLVQQGFSQAAYVGYQRAAWNVERIEGLSRAGLELTLYEVEEPTSDAAERLAARVLLGVGAQRFNLVIGCNDLVSIGLMAQAGAFGLRIPEDVAFAGFDNIATSRFVTPPLTTVDTCSEETGELLFRYVLALIDETPIPRPAQLEPFLVIRDSTRRQTASSPATTV